MQEKKKIPGFVFIVILFAICITGCRTIKAIPDGTLIEHNLRVAELERTIDDLTARLGHYDSLIGNTISRLDAVRGRAAGIADTAERLAYLFGEYERVVYELLNAYELLQDEIRRRDEEKPHPVLGVNELDDT